MKVELLKFSIFKFIDTLLYKEESKTIQLSCLILLQFFFFMNIMIIFLHSVFLNNLTKLTNILRLKV